MFYFEVDALLYGGRTGQRDGFSALRALSKTCRALRSIVLPSSWARAVWMPWRAGGYKTPLTSGIESNPHLFPYIQSPELATLSRGRPSSNSPNYPDTESIAYSAHPQHRKFSLAVYAFPLPGNALCYPIRVNIDPWRILSANPSIFPKHSDPELGYLRDTTPNIHKLSVEGRLYGPSFSIDLVEQSIRSMAGMANLSALTIRYSLDVTHIESWTVEPEDHVNRIIESGKHALLTSKAFGVKELRLCYLKHYHGTQKILTHETVFTLMNGKWSTDVHYVPTGLRDCDLVNLTG
ncbi:hypothetical protein B0H16DRAFT_1787930 [Mycena metata]|uniref:Uncharacterized protein n=1 Tax=Mycena metata TaxID=1033252 RepID=A0AAD7HLA6_9AGAR|nr:hypothetical protein B0H16DRAFT_1787930 [Mycena metata]